MKEYYVYILTNKNNHVLYIGVTNNLARRIFEHKQKLVKGFTSKYNVDKLVYFETFSDPINAIQREKSLKNLIRLKKVSLIRSTNPNFEEIKKFN